MLKRIIPSFSYLFTGNLPHKEKLLHQLNEVRKKAFMTLSYYENNELKKYGVCFMPIDLEALILLIKRPDWLEKFKI